MDWTLGKSSSEMNAMGKSMRGFSIAPRASRPSFFVSHLLSISFLAILGLCFVSSLFTMEPADDDQVVLNVYELAAPEGPGI